MKKIIILLIFTIVICSCQYKIAPTDAYISYNNLYTIGANATEVEIKYALERNKEFAEGEKIIAVEGYIKTDSIIFDNLKKTLQDETDVELDLSKAVMENTDYTHKLENALFLKTVSLAISQKVTANFFNGCTSLVNLQLPSSLTAIEDTSFANCTSLQQLEYLGTSPNMITGTPFAAITSFTDLYLPNVKTDPQDKSWDNFLGITWANIHYGKSMPK